MDSKAIEEDQIMIETKNQEIVLDKGNTSPKENEIVESQKTLVPVQTEEPTLKEDNPQPSSHTNVGQEPVVTGLVTPENRIDIQSDTDIEGFTT
ncbi:3540_t:CDS:2, partial [Gigaspora margarita]